MQKKTLIYFVLCATFIISMVMPVFAVSSKDPIQMKSYLVKPEGPPGLDKKPKPDDDAGASVDIRNIATGETLKGNILVIAEVNGDADNVFLEANGVSQEMTQVGATNRYETTWIAVGNEVTLVVNAENEGTVVGSASVAVTVTTKFLYELYYEIDYIAGYRPDEAVLDYWVSYWGSRAIFVDYDIDEEVVGYNDDGEITETEFWAIEKAYNDGDDNYGYSPSSEDFTSDEKWMLYGSKFSISNVGGFTYVLRGGSAGNFIFIADQMIMDFESQYGLPENGAEVTVVCHETGHSIGILVTRGQSEKYDPDRYSVMSTMTIENSNYMAGSWYYSKEYWATCNLEYYVPTS